MDRVRLACVAALAAATSLSCTEVYPQCKAAPEVAAPPEADYLLVVSESSLTAGKPRDVEISDTPKYRSARSTLRTAAIRLPDSCLHESAAQVTGEAHHTQEIVQTACGVWLSELERSLVRAQFRVVSWDSLRGLERSENLPAYAAAQKLGADIVFLFNSLEASNVKAGSEAAMSHRYFHSNAKGEQLAPYPMADEERAPIREFVKAKLGTPAEATADAGVTALSATLDATAILTDSGESVWFYRNTTVEPVSGTEGMRFLFEKHGNQWYPAEPERPKVQKIETSTVSAVDSTGVSVQATKDPYKQERLALVRAVARDFVSRFRNGTSGE